MLYSNEISDGERRVRKLSTWCRPTCPGVHESRVEICTGRAARKPGPARPRPGPYGPGRADNLLISNGPGRADFFAGRAGKFRPVHGP